MCLRIVKDEKPRIAKKDILCYKVISSCGDGTYQTYYQLTDVVIGETYKSKVIVRPNGTTIGVGLHSYSNKKALFQFNYDLLSDPIRGVKCIIPKGSTYYVGDFCGDRSYASDQLTYVKIIR